MNSCICSSFHLVSSFFGISFFRRKVDAEEGGFLSEIVNDQLGCGYVVNLRNGYHKDNVIDSIIT